MSLQNSNVKILVSKEIILADGVFERQLGYEGEAFTDGISAFMAKTLDSFMTPCNVIVQECCLETRKQVLTNTKFALIFDFLVFRTVKNRFLFFINHTVYSVLSQQAQIDLDQIQHR